MPSPPAAAPELSGPYIFIPILLCRGVSACRNGISAYDTLRYEYKEPSNLGQRRGGRPRGETHTRKGGGRLRPTPPEDCKVLCHVRNFPSSQLANLDRNKYIWRAT